MVLAAGVVLLAQGPPPDVVRWDQTRPGISTDGKTLELTVAGGACDEGYRAEVDYSSQVVEVTVLVTDKAGGDCPADLIDLLAVVRLDQPLGSRPLLDGHCTHPDAEFTRASDGCPAEPVYPVLDTRLD